MLMRLRPLALGATLAFVGGCTSDALTAPTQPQVNQVEASPYVVFHDSLPTDLTVTSTDYEFD